MAKVQSVAVWPASLHEMVELKETPFKLIDSKAGILARACWWALKKMNALQPYSETVRTWQYVPHEQKALIDAMIEAASDDFDYIYKGKAVFIIGGKTFSELTGAPAFRDMMRFAVGEFGHVDAYGGRRFYDIPIHVVPGMIGMAVVPKVIIETRNT